MPANGIFAKQMARKIEAHEIGEVGGAINVAGTFHANSCAVGGGVDGEIFIDGPAWN
jgi:hypothetical protein